VGAAAICGSDKHAFRRTLPPRIAGHEVAGTIVAFGSEAPGARGRCTWREGDRVVVAPVIGCGTCAACGRESFGDCATARVTLGAGRPGGFAEYLTVPARSLIPLAESLSFVQGSIVEPSSVGWHASGLPGVAGKRCPAVGAGAVGLLTGQAALVRGAAEVWAADVRPDHLEIAVQLGLRTVHAAAHQGAITGCGPFEVVFECVGWHDGPLATALDALEKQGALVLVGSGHPGGLPTRTVVQKHLTVYGSPPPPVTDLRAAHDLVAAGRIRVDPLVSAVFPLAEITAAFTASLDAQKVVVQP